MVQNFGVLQKKVLNMFEIIFDSKIIIPKVNIDGKQCNIPSFVFRSFEPSQEQNISHNTLAIDYHNDDILRDINYKNIHSQNYIKPLNHIDFLTNVDDSTINLDISNSSDFDNMDSRMHKITRDLTQFAFNIVLLPPTVGGITEVLSNDGIDSYAPTKIGDLFIFCCQSSHRIYSSTPTRTTMGGFIVNINSSNKKYIFG